jgi:hypothetical protein
MNTCPASFGVQALLIFETADTTLTFAIPKLQENGEYAGNFNGVGSVHKCRDWEAVKGFLVENRAQDMNRSILHT